MVAPANSIKVPWWLKLRDRIVNRLARDVGVWMRTQRPRAKGEPEESTFLEEVFSAVGENRHYRERILQLERQLEVITRVSTNFQVAHVAARNALESLYWDSHRRLTPEQQEIWLNRLGRPLPVIYNQ